MSEKITVPVAALLFDEQNPRLPGHVAGQREAFRELADAQGPQLRALADHILRNGLNPAQLTIVMPGPGNRYWVLEGNRRLSALRALENPEALADKVTANVLSALRRFSKEYQDNPITEIECVLVRDREEAAPWIELLHGGALGGAGLVGWGSDETARYRARGGGRGEIDTAVLNFLEDRGRITRAERSAARPTTLRRILLSKPLREKVGITWSKGNLSFLGNPEHSANALMHIVNQLRTEALKVGDVMTAAQREVYANSFPPRLVVKPTEGVSQAAQPTNSTTPTTPPSPPRAAPRRSREQLIPRDCVLTITNARLQNIERELRTLKLESFPNAVSVLFRVFMELSADEYLTRHNVPVKNGVDRANLENKLRAATDHLVHDGKLTEMQAKPVRRMAQKESYVGASLTTMHQWVHNPYMVPTPTDLRNDWDSLQPWFAAVWPA